MTLHTQHRVSDTVIMFALLAEVAVTAKRGLYWWTLSGHACCEIRYPETEFNDISILTFCTGKIGCVISRDMSWPFLFSANPVHCRLSSNPTDHHREEVG